MEIIQIKTNIVLSILSFVLALFSSIFVIITLWQNKKLLKQNQKMLDLNQQSLCESIRPFVTIYIDALTICEQTSYFVLKNLGHSPALITHFEYDQVLKQTPQIFSLLNDQFDFIGNTILAPGQSKLLQYDVALLPVDTVTFAFTYEHGGKSYHESVTLNVKNYIHLPVVRPTSHVPEDREREIHTLREMLERSL